MSGSASHAEGNITIADASYAHAEGSFTSANGRKGAHIMGQNGAADDLDFSWYLANGTNAYDPAGIVAKILSNGNVCFLVCGNNFTPGPVAFDYAEMFETDDGELIDVGYFITLNGGIRKVNATDNYILGTSSNPGVAADAVEPGCRKYVLDESNRI